MTTVLDEITESNITPEHIRRRVADWKKRIDDLYAQIAGWLPNGYSLRHGKPMWMNEKMMREYDVPDEEVPVLEILKDDLVVGRIEPRVLWILGPNGRLQFLAGGQHFLIDDRAEIFDPPKWTAMPFMDRRNRRPLDREVFQSLLPA